jgi:hypothetical protein
VSLNYIEEKLFAAVQALATDERPVRQRLLHAYRDSVSKVGMFAGDLPEEERQLFDSIVATMTKVEPVGEEGSIEATVKAMSEAEATKVIQKIIMLLQRVTWESATRARQEGRAERFPYHPSDN